MSASFHMVMDVASNKPVAETVTILRKNYIILEHYYNKGLHKGFTNNLHPPYKQLLKMTSTSS